MRRYTWQNTAGASEVVKRLGHAENAVGAAHKVEESY